MHILNRFYHVSSTFVNNTSPLSDRLFFKTGRFPVQFIRHFGFRKPKDPKLCVSKNPKEEGSLSFARKAVKRNDLQRELNFSYDLPSKESTEKHLKIFAKKVKSEVVLSKEIPQSYFHALTATMHIIKNDKTTRSDHIVKEFADCISKIMCRLDITNYKIALKIIHNAFQACHLQINYPEQHNQIMKAIILPKLCSLLAESQLTTKDFVFLLDWMRRCEVALILAINPIANQEVSRLFLKALVHLKNEIIGLSAIDFSLIIYCAWKLNLDGQYLDKEEFSQIILSCAQTAIVDPLLDVRLATSIFYSLIELFKIKRSGSPFFAEIVLDWGQKVFELVVWEFNEGDKSNKRIGVLANTVVNSLEVLSEVMVNYENGLDENDRKKIFASIYPNLCKASILSVPHLNVEGTGLFRMIDSFDAINFQWHQFPLELKNIFRNIFLCQMSVMPNKNFSTFINWYYKLRAPYQELLNNLSDQDIFWRQVLHQIQNFPATKNVAGPSMLMTSLGGYGISWETDVPEYLRNELINVFIRNSSDYSGYQLAMFFRSLSGMKASFRNISQHAEFSVTFSAAFSRSLRIALPSVNAQSLCILYQSLSKMGCEWKQFSLSQRNLLTFHEVDMATCKDLKLSSYSLSIIFQSLVSMEASWDSLSPNFHQFLWKALQRNFSVPMNPASFSLLIWSLGEMGWHWDNLIQCTTPLSGDATSRATGDQQVFERILQTMENTDSLKNTCQILKGQVEMQCPVSHDTPSSKQLWFKIWKNLNDSITKEEYSTKSLGTILRSIPLLFFDVPEEVYMEHEANYLAVLLDKVFAQASIVFGNSTEDTAASKVQVTMMMLFLNYGLPHQSTTTKSLLEKYPMFQLPKEFYSKSSNSWILSSSQKTLDSKRANNTSLPYFQFSVAKKFQQRLPENYKIIHEFPGLGDMFPVDIAIVKYEQTSSGESTRRLVGFLEVDGPHHYHAQIPISTAVQQPQQLKLRRLDNFKEFMYRCQFPDVSLFMRIPFTISEEAVALDKLLDQVVQQIVETD